VIGLDVAIVAVVERCNPALESFELGFENSS
jgi:hypothetical protein